MTRLFWIRLLGALLLLTLLGAAIAPLSVFAEDPLTVTGGKVCSLTEPLGIEGTPVFSWTATSTKRDDGQSTYRIVLAKTKKDAENAENLVWDSGEVASSSMLDIPYTGKALDSRTSYYWRVTIKSRKGDTAKSEVFRFSTGVESTAWTGDWIGMPSPKPTLSLSGTQWIWLASGASFSGVPAGSEYFRFSFDIPADKTPEAFEIAYTADDSAEVFLNGTKVSEMSLWSDGSFYQGTELLVSGKNTVAIAATNASAGYAGLCARLKVSYTDGTADIYTTNKTAWKVSKTAPSNWKLASFDDSAWSAPDQAVTFGSSPWGTGVTLRGESSRAAVYLRREFTLDKEIKEALVSLCGLGFFDLTVNGKSPDDSVLNPFTTQYDVAVYYRTFDLTSLLKKGDNAIAVELGNSYYNEIGGVWNWASAAWRDDPKLMLRLDIRYADGTSDVIVSDTDWKATNQGPITANSMYYGDVYDARLAMDGFNQAGFDDSAWQAAAVMAKPLGKLESQMKAPVSRVASFAPAEIVKLGDGSWRVESPEMVAGWVLLKNIDQKAGDKITLTYGQKLNADGTVLKYGSVDGELASWYPHAYFQQDIYYSAGGNKESYEPKFSYKGFEYVQIDGYDGELTADDVVIYRVSNDVEIISEFSSSNELFNQLHHCMVVALADNFQGEHCDPMLEKNGWLGDANVSLTSMSFNFDMAATLPGFLELMEDTQEKYGFVPQMVPAANWGIQNTAVWNTVFIYGAEELEKYFGTLSYSEAQYDAMRKMAVRDINEMKANNWVWHDNQLADWVAPIGGSNPNVAYNENMSEGSGIVGTAFVYGTLSYMKALAERMGKTADAKEYADAMTKIYTAFNKKFYNEAKGYYETKTWSQIGTRTKYRQTSNLVPLAFGLVPEEHIDSVVKSIVEDIKDKNYHLDTGCVGTRYILPILCDYGYSDVAYRVATQTTYPSWGFWIENGAKSTWEMWESTTRSFDHYFLGTYEEWFFSHLGGIKQVENGYESFVIEPSFIGDLTEVNTRVNTVRGELVSAWKVSDTGVVELTVTVPFGSTAKVLLPCADTADVTIGGNPVTLSVDGVHSVSDQGDTVAITVGSGTYVFAVKADKVGMTVYRDSLDAALLQLKLYLDDNAFLSERAAMTALWEKSLAVYQDENATQLAVNAAAEEIEAYLTHLVGSESRNALRDAIETSKTKYPRVLYPEEAYATYRAALRDAEAKAADHSLHDDALEAALAALLAAEQTLDAARYPNLAL
ncbi:MAG: family 78 glycoside hydrolase catalytic domain, partial [Clostridia bacterium]|nr:family 78 glycoside hydrolase catalytic domain [Clostridia bacterium]